MKIALYIAFQNKSSIDCCKEIIDLISENNQLIIDSKFKVKEPTLEVALTPAG